MRNWILIIISLFLFQVNSFAQEEGDAFLTLLEKGKAAFEKKDYDTCISCYKKAEIYQPQNAWLKYAAARCYDSKKKKKSTYQNLTKAIQLDWEDVEDWLVNSESDFSYLKKKKRCWKKVQKEIKAQQKEMNLTLREELIQMEKADQKYRIEIQEKSKKGNYNASVVNELWKKQLAIDSRNLKRSEEIIAEYGYPSKKLVGKKAAKSIFLIVQHAELKYQQKYISLFQKAVKSGDLDMKTLALMLDRIEVRKGRPQIYGTQIGEDQKTEKLTFDPIVDERKVNKRRAYIGLPSIESYAQRFDFEYQYKKQKYVKADFRKFKGGWDLVNIRDAETFEITFLPKQNFWVEFLAKGRLRFNRSVNTCEMIYQATDTGRLVFTPNLDCTENCCDDKKISQTLNYHDVIEFELYNNVLFLIDTKGKIWEFKRKKYKKQRLQQEDN
ncbi:MAG: DUF6624 domain-containing protein [Saprospiraceae bacterium]